MTSLNLLTGFLLLTSIGLHKEITIMHFINFQVVRDKSKNNNQYPQATCSCSPAHFSSLVWSFGTWNVIHQTVPFVTLQKLHLQAHALYSPLPIQYGEHQLTNKRIPFKKCNTSIYNLTEKIPSQEIHLRKKIQDLHFLPPRSVCQSQEQNYCISSFQSKA